MRVSFDVGLYPKIPTEEGFGVKLPSHSSPSSRPWPTTGAQFGRCLLEFGSAVSGAERKKMWQELVGMRHGVKGDFNTGFQDICGNILRILRICSAHAVKGVNIQHRYCLIFGYLTALTVSRDLTPCNINSDASGLPLTHMSKTLPRFCCVLRCANSGPRFLCNGPSQLHDRCGSKPDGVQHPSVDFKVLRRSYPLGGKSPLAPCRNHTGNRQLPFILFTQISSRCCSG